MSAGEMDCSGGIEVEALEFNKSKLPDEEEEVTVQCPRRLLFLVLALFAIMTASAVAGFMVLSSKKKSSSTSAIAIDLNASDNLNVTNNNDNDGGLVPDDADQFGVVDLQDKDTKATKQPTAAPSPAPTVAQTAHQSGAATGSSTSGYTTEFSSSASSLATAVWNDRPPSDQNPDQNIESPDCPDHKLVVSSSCVSGSANALSTASFCFASKRDGDWYWVRNSVGALGLGGLQYDSWDYTEETEGELTFLDLSRGNYIVSLVRDSMEPYDEIVSQEFTVPACE
jgi:hypothetical protein